ncbi:MAG: S1 RNA-binding domain-containing protein [Candidatus Omnitrophica bacterium]|nr:S1 RNA-binding domain-containing protein [Candidatus Omnitrophota bacterium]
MVLKNSMGDNGFKIGDSVEAVVTKIQNFGAIVTLKNNTRGLIHISQVSDDFVKDINDYLKVGDRVTARVKKVGADGKLDLTLRKKKAAAAAHNEKEFRFSSLQEKMDEFLKKSGGPNIGDTGSNTENNK